MTNRVLRDLQKVLDDMGVHDVEIWKAKRGHYHVRLPNGAVVVAPGTPGSRSNHLAFAGDVRRALRNEKRGGRPPG